jgi:hypothetical protein
MSDAKQHVFVHRGPMRTPLELCLTCGHIFANTRYHDGRTKREAPRATRKKVR